jgi:hypothetical protein
MTAYVTQYNPRHNYASLKSAAGDVEFLTQDEYMPLPLPSHDRNKEIIKDISNNLVPFEPEKDFLVPVGSPIAIGLAFAALQDSGVGEFNVLKWNNQSNKYDVAKIFL